MATYLNTDISKEGTLNVGDNVIYSCPAGYIATLTQFKIINLAAYNISLRIERANPSENQIYYSFTLDPSDLIQDANVYNLKSKDKLIIKIGRAHV